MSRDEIRARAAGLVRRKLGWLATGNGHDDAWLARTLGDPASRPARLAALTRALTARVYGEDWTPARLADSLRAAGVSGRIVAEAESLVAHRFPVLGYGVRDAGPAIDWHRDLVSEARWPRRYWGFMTRGQAERWDPKVVWEPSRHQHFLVLAAASALTGERAYAGEVADQLAGWIAQNPPAVGIHWVESIEPALRLLTWLWTLPLIADAPGFSPEAGGAVLRSVLAQARHVAANLSTYTAPNTHLIAEALALFVVGTVLPGLEPSTRWQEQGRAILEREIVAQVGDDGVYREASLYYHAYAVELYVLAVIVAERNRVLLAPVVRARLERMFEALAWLVRPDGSLPNVGDADGGRSLRLGERASSSRAAPRCSDARSCAPVSRSRARRPPGSGPTGSPASGVCRRFRHCAGSAISTMPASSSSAAVSTTTSGTCSSMPAISACSRAVTDMRDV
jgi:hypothetical protein